jgi:hypothetical protein
MTNIAIRRAEQLKRIYATAPLEDDPKPDENGILLSDQITYYATHHDMISPFLHENLKPAGYELTVGDEYFMSGEFLKLRDSVTILPFEVAVLKTGEFRGEEFDAPFARIARMGPDRFDIYWIARPRISLAGHERR